MASITYSLKDGQLPIKVHVGANETSATICWVGIVTTTDTCVNCGDEKIFCESIYIGANECVDGESSGRTIEGSITWHDNTITYKINQDAAICSTCGSATTECEILNYWVSPYVVTPAMSSTTLYWEYWLTKEDDCEIIREKKISSKETPINTDIDCHEENRTKKVSATTECGGPVVGEYYIQKPDVCCDLSGNCYEINEIVYNPTSVPSSGGDVDFTFDYKHIEIDENCETKETYGTYFGTWNVPPCSGDDCCFVETIESSFTWNDICGRGNLMLCKVNADKYDKGDVVYIPSSATSEENRTIKFTHEEINDKNTIYLSILRDKSLSADCDIHCDFETLYCVDSGSIRTEYYDYDNGKWVLMESGGTPVNEYTYPYYGGRLKVSWNYYIITVYEDCSVGISSGNPYSDVLEISELDECDESSAAESVSTRVLTRGEGNSNNDKCHLTVKNGEICSDIGGTVTVSVVEDWKKFKIPYVFKKGLCDLLPSQLQIIKRNLPDNFKYLANDCTQEKKCNEFEVSYIQYTKECNPDCAPCLYEYMTKDAEGKNLDSIGSGATVYQVQFNTDCDLNVYAYGDGDKGNNGKYINDCSGWVTSVTIDKQSGYIKFGITENGGTYRRGKVIFTHDNDCKEMFIINQQGLIDDVEEYIPDPGYSCDIELKVSGVACTTNGGTINIAITDKESEECELTFTTAYTGKCQAYDYCICNSVGNAIRFTVNGSMVCDETKITITPISGYRTISGCKGRHKIGEYSYTCSNFNINLLGARFDYSGIIDSIEFGAPSNKQGNIYATFTTNETGAERTIQVSYEYNYIDITDINYTQQKKTEECNEDFDALLSEFNTILEEENLRKINPNSNVYEYLVEGYNYAVNAYNGNYDEYGFSRLFNKQAYDEVFVGDTSTNNAFANGKASQWGTDSTYEDDGTALSAMTSWLMAMQISELCANYGVSNNNQTRLFKKAFEIGGGNKKVPIYGKYKNNQFNGFTIKGDINIARIAASAIYAVMRSEYSFSNVDDDLRSEIGGSLINRDSFWSELQVNIKQNCSNTWDDRNVIGYSCNLNNIFPSAAGPFASNYYFGIYNDPIFCDAAPSRSFPHEQVPDGTLAKELFNVETASGNTKNYIFDEMVDSYVVEHYNLDSSDINLERTVQAVADNEDNTKHMLAKDTYYINNNTNVRGYFTPGTPSDYTGCFRGVFNKDVIGKDLSSKITDEDGYDTDLQKFFGSIMHMGSVARYSILDVQWGRRRPGQGVKDYITSGNEKIGTPRYVEGTTENEMAQNIGTHCYNCDKSRCRQNQLNDATITHMTGAGTKQYGDKWYSDMNGNGIFDSNNDPYYGGDYETGIQNIHYCASLHATTYPSGHSAEAWAMGLFLMMMISDRDKNKWYEIYKAAYKYSVSRTINRAHWNSDIIYGKLAATTIVPVINAFGEDETDENTFRTLYNSVKNIIDNA